MKKNVIQMLNCLKRILKLVNEGIAVQLYMWICVCAFFFN